MKKEQAIKECETLKRCLMQYSDEPNNIKSGQAIETVLNMIKEKDKELDIKEEQIEYIKNEYGKTIEEQGKEIDLMAEQLAGLVIWNNEKEEPIILGNKEEVKQYFERKESDGRN